MKPDDGSQREMLDPSDGPLYLKLGEVARFVGVPPSTIRHWQEVFDGFLHPVRTASGRHVYSREDLRVFRAIRFLVRQEGLGSREARDRLPEVLGNPGVIEQDTVLPDTPHGTHPGSVSTDAPAFPTESGAGRIQELEALLDQARQENQRLRKQLDALERMVSDWARMLEEEATDRPVSAPPG